MIRKTTLPLTAVSQVAVVDGLLKPVAIAVQIFGTFTATLLFEVTVDGTNWVACELMTSADQTDTSLVASVSAAGLWVSKVPLAVTAFRVRCSAFTSSASGVVTVRAA
jgi:hypothetical protein